MLEDELQEAWGFFNVVFKIPLLLNFAPLISLEEINNEYLKASTLVVGFGSIYSPYLILRHVTFLVITGAHADLL